MKKLSLLLWVTTTACAGEPSLERQTTLRNLLNHDCGACHGLTLKGGLGTSLLPEALEGKPDEFLISTILEGRKGTAMPPWQPLMTHDDAAWLLSFLRTTSHK